MKLTRSLGIATSVLMLAAVFLTFAPSVAAQGEQDVNVNVKENPVVGGLGKEARLSPDIEKAEAKFRLSVTVPATTACVGKSFTLTYAHVETSLAPHAIVAISPQSETKNYESGSDVPAGTNLGGTKSKEIEYTQVVVTISFKQTAPAFVDQVVKIQAELTGGGTSTSGQQCSAKPTTQKPTFSLTIKADFLPIVQFVPKEIIQKAGQNAKVIFPVEITNLSNGEAKVDSDYTGGAGLAAVQPPADGLIVESKATRGDKANNKVTSQITVLTPTKNGYTNKVYPFEAVFTYTSATPAEVPPTEVSVPLSVKVQGVYVPGFDGASMVGALGVALVGLGLSRRKT